ncbi:MAG: DoxX family membrane protein [Solirubrobacterales bacterium]|nr:DoxX family membrane protein [Solirubrobacterales bacterium]
MAEPPRILRRRPPALALVPLRAFLGVTFIYAGVQKLSDPGFLHPGAPTYIGNQLTAFARGTPGGFLLRAFAMPHPQLAGVGVAFVELLVGLLVLLGLLTRAAATAGLLLNLVLFLTNSWHTYPYFLGSDIVFVFAWLPFVLAGSQGQPALDEAMDRLERLRARRAARFAARRARSDRDVGPAGLAPITRRSLLGATGMLALVIGAISALTKGSYHGTAVHLDARSGQASAAATGHESGGARAVTGRGRTAAARDRLPQGAVRIGAAGQLPPGQGALYRDPATHRPDIVIRHTDGSLTAFSAVCTHQGCTVGYQGGEIVCPCHGSRFSSETGAVLGGPAPLPLTGRRVIERAGSLYSLPA